ncbi:MAG: hypothetical protein A2817_00245 [Candidatus Yanofskybacteria bacterium RIFCSPHIGHO2_01_FULL_39_8b]|uniref:Peptidase S1 domain-containing protein n=1 Tax=Candidatus Yanofskybacteria bacterium RIFCSPHIGHO2_01_FULL_39_8b TaxID=1802659 RepID=A0A1F8EFE8_9BACT|nr:MAG: hypothetical protein A2817_00245 [Candidatus Yanofskybacteria bacterium RIFCSPHIGHO2_01_FULL_39_8b]
MKSKNRALSALIASFFIFSSCGADPELKKGKTFNQDFTSDAAYLVLEKNDKPYIMASGFLVNKKSGIFITAKHFTDEFRPLGADSCKVFFNGKAYMAELTRVPPTKDMAAIKISSPFNFHDFPEPMPRINKRPKTGEKVYIRGFHPHAYRIRERNKFEGFPDKVVPVFENYYGQIMKDLTKETQVVFDNLEGRAAESDPDSVRKNRFLSDKQKKELLKFENDNFIKIVMARDHKFSFGGLSGGLAVNDRNEVIGVITAQDIFRFEFDEHGLFFDPRSSYAPVIVKQFFDTLYITPIEFMADIETYVETIK